jgi:hypothetical protein
MYRRCNSILLPPSVATSTTIMMILLRVQTVIIQTVITMRPRSDEVIIIESKRNQREYRYRIEKSHLE